MIAALDAALYEKNKVLLKPIVNATTETEFWVAVVKVEWATELRGITKDEQRGLWLEHSLTESDLQLLVDKGWFSTSRDDLFPGKPAFLLVQPIKCKQSLVLQSVKSRAREFTAKSVEEACRWQVKTDASKLQKQASNWLAWSSSFFNNGVGWDL